jgi:hypothetical protein
MKILISRHNGLGDIVMAVPYVGNFLKLGYQVTFECVDAHWPWLQKLLPGVQCKNLDVDPYSDYRQVHHQYDHFLNFNRCEQQDGFAIELRRIYPKTQPVNMQYLYGIMCRLRGLHTPRELSPSKWVMRPGTLRTGSPVIFTKSTSPTRTMGATLLEKLREAFPTAEVDPTYPNKLALIEAMGHAPWMIGMDSGAIHVAEMMGTPWVCLHTTFDHPSRHQFYVHGTSIQSSKPMSPCYEHGGCRACDGEHVRLEQGLHLTCIDAFDVQEIRFELTELLNRLVANESNPFHPQGVPDGK